jgi:hypothetical protein
MLGRAISAVKPSGFLWHWLGTSDDTTVRRAFSKLVKEATGIRLPALRDEKLVVLDTKLVENDGIQSSIFSRIVGQFMGSDKRKGFTYTWIPKHLSDAKGRVSLRSFMIAIREAAKARLMSAATSVTPDAIKAGVRAASSNRIEQLIEDYPWIKDVLPPLEGLQTPNTITAFKDRWIEDKTVEKIFEECSRPDTSYLMSVQLDGVKPTRQHCLPSPSHADEYKRA